jgi:YD repeat-containing protein
MNRPATEPDGGPQILLTWLVRLRWLAAVGQGAAVGVATGLLGFELPLLVMLTLIGLTVLSNLGIVLAMRVLPQSALDEIRAWRQQFEHQGDGPMMTIGYADGQGGYYYAANSSTAPQPHPSAYVAPACTPPSPGWHLAAGGTPPAGRVLCIADPFGRQLNFRYDAQARVIAIADPTGHLIEFEYDGDSAVRWNVTNDPAPNVITRISGADWAVRTLHYNEQSHINNGNVTVCTRLPATGLPRQLTGTSDGTGQRMRTWTYDCQGRATGALQ